MEPLATSPEQSRPGDAGLAARSVGDLIVGLLAGAVVWCLVQAAHPLFRVSKEFDVPNIGAPVEKFLAHRREQDRVDRQHSAIYLGLLGALLAAGLGAREAAGRRSWLRPLFAALPGAAGGAIGGILGCLVLAHVRTTIGQAEIMHTAQAQLATCLPLGLGVGLGSGLAVGGFRAIGGAALSGLAAGAACGIVYPLAVSLLLPTASTDALLPEGWGPRLLWFGVVSAVLGLVIPLARRRSADRAA